MLAAIRHANMTGIYDIHTNQVLRPAITQPTHVRWEPVLDEVEQEPSLSNRSATNGVLHAESAGANGTVVEIDEPPSSPSRKPHIPFPPVPPVVARNFLVADTIFENPTIPNPPTPGTTIGGSHPLGDLHSLSSVGEDILAELPPECRAAFEEAKAKELMWRWKWDGEKRDGYRAKLRIHLAGFPL